MGRTFDPRAEETTSQSDRGIPGFLLGGTRTGSGGCPSYAHSTRSGDPGALEGLFPRAPRGCMMGDYAHDN